MAIDRLEPEFVEFIPPELQSGILYITLAYKTTVHLCASGCGNKVVLPLSPAEWKLTYDGESVSMFPSVGNWEYPCRAHYWIRKGEVHWSADWSDERIEAGRARDELELDAYLASRATGRLNAGSGRASLWARVFRRP